MALTRAEADKYSTNQVLTGVAEITMDQNPLLGLLPFVPIRGNALQYQRELAASAPTFIAPGGTVTEGVPTTTLITIALKILIGDADIDKFLRITRSKDQDLRAELLSIKARNFADTWGDKAIYGSIDADANEFDGLPEIISDDATLQQVHAGAFSAKTGSTASSIFAVRRDDQGLFGVSAEDPNAQDQLESIIQLETVGTLETKDANRYRLKHYGAIALKATQAVGRLDGISSGAWTN